MPELPEAEVVARQLRHRLVGAHLKDCWVGRPDIVRQGLDQLDWYRGARIAGVERYGKTVVLALVQESREPETRFLAAELGMTGLLLFRTPHPGYQKHTHLILTLTDCPEPELRYWNPRRFGRIWLLDQTRLHGFLARRFGWDPLRGNREDFFRMVKARRGRIKALLLHQQRVAGIGNIYANEILYRARIHPHAKGSRLSRPAILRLYEAMRGVLEEAIAHGGSTIRDFLAPDGTAGRFQERHRVYNRAGQPCQICGTGFRRLVTERSSFYCPRCQVR
ncbi:MAG: bifunctional DNA-formamidopyrimidine glycosylase/DNA-(apurinic or apyrimidinic site) lyase [Nitrospirales bacterium]